MKLTPIEIRKGEFRKTLRGYDPIEVDTFLDMIADQWEKQIEEKKELNNRLIELETKLKDYQNTEKMMRETLVNVQEVKKQSEESSKRQADLIIKEAELKSLEILENARKQARQMREEVTWLKSQKESFINRLRHILMSQIELLSVLEIDDVIPEEMQKVLKSAKARRQASLQSAKKAQETVVKKDEADAGQQESTVERTPSIEIEDTGQNVLQTQAGGESKKSAESEQIEKNVEQELSEEDINEFIKKGIQIDELINTLNKKGKKK